MAVRTKLGFRAQPMVNANSVFLRLFQDPNHLSVQSSVSQAFVRSKLCYRPAEACDSIGGFAHCRFVGDDPMRIDDQSLVEFLRSVRQGKSHVHHHDQTDDLRRAARAHDVGAPDFVVRATKAMFAYYWAERTSYPLRVDEPPSLDNTHPVADLPSFRPCVS